ncbi:MAG: PEP-CTERM sorting domain-containing protein [Akkermansiaceae bacterium]
MIGTISRVTTFNSALSDSDILSHSNAWSVPEPTSLLFSGLAALALLGRRR